jgi:hypothetical protein
VASPNPIAILREKFHISKKVTFLKWGQSSRKWGQSSRINMKGVSGQGQSSHGNINGTVKWGQSSRINMKGVSGQGQSSHGNINGTVALGLTDGRKWGQSSRINTLITYC